MTTINVRVDENVKKQAGELFEELGLDMSTAMNMFLRQSIRHGGLPFEVKTGKAETLAAIQEGRELLKNPNRKTYDTFSDLLNDVKNED